MWKPWRWLTTRAGKVMLRVGMRTRSTAAHCTHHRFLPRPPSRPDSRTNFPRCVNVPEYGPDLANNSQDMNSEDVQGRAIEFEEFVANLLRTVDPSLMIDVERGADAGIDVLGERSDGTITVVEVKTDTPSTTSRLTLTLSRLQEAAQRLPPSSEKRLILAVPGVLSDENRQLVEGAGVELWDGPQLAAMMDQAGLPAPVGVPLARHLVTTKPRGMQLRHRLRTIAPGKRGWSAYQQFCEEALDFLFRPPLEAPLSETSDAVRVNRRDFILPNYAGDGFWSFMRTHYSADHVVVDAKNFTGLVTKTAVLQVTNYLSARGAGLFGLIITRRGAERGALWTIREQWVLYGKLVVVLVDNDMRQMLTARDAGDDPSITIRQKIEDFRLAL